MNIESVDTFHYIIKFGVGFDRYADSIKIASIALKQDVTYNIEQSIVWLLLRYGFLFMDVTFIVLHLKQSKKATNM